MMGEEGSFIKMGEHVYILGIMGRNMEVLRIENCGLSLKRQWEKGSQWAGDMREGKVMCLWLGAYVFRAIEIHWKSQAS